MADLAAVMAEHRRNVGFREGPNNDNPWGPEQGVGNHQAYCDSATSMVAWHNGVRWWPDCTFKDKGCAYTVTHVAVARTHGKYVEDHASQGNPAPLAVGQPVFFDWNGNGSVDHVETIAELPQGPTGDQFVTIGYNTGNPNGCWRVVRDRKYLHGTIVMDWAYSAAPAPAPSTPPSTKPQPTTPPASASDFKEKVKHMPQLQQGSTGQYVRNMQGLLCANGQTVAIDGDFGSKTKGALASWQKRAGLANDGVCGPVTWAHLIGV